MARKLGLVALLLAISLPACAGGKPATISGFVRTSTGSPQMGAAVEIAAGPSARVVFTDAKGHFSAADLAPGTYDVRVTAPAFLPSMRENVSVAPGAHLIINLTLNTLFEAAQFLPARPRVSEDDDDWKWTLRSSANRPILRVLDDGPPVLVSEQKSDDRRLKGQVVFLAGSEAEGFGAAPAMGTAFSVQQSIFSSGTLSFDGNLGYGNGPAGVVRAAYSHRFSNGLHPEFALTVRRFGSPGNTIADGALEALALSATDGITLADVVELNYGGELQTVQFGQRVSGFRPFGSVAVHVTSGTIVQYRYATSEPDMRGAKGFDTAPADLSESGPRMSLAESQPALERAHHHELSLSHRLAGNNFQVALYSDQISNAALVGVGDVTAASSDFLPDVYSGTFTYNGGTLSTNGVRVVYSRKLAQELTATVDYAFGGVVALDRSAADWESVQASLHNERRHAFTGKIAGGIPRYKTRWIASYKWTSGGALTPVDLFNASPGQADPYLNVFLRQPLPTSSFLPGRMEAIVDLRNLLAQGYIPVLAQDGQTVYLVQSARSIRGGLSFTF
ncbi:MAG: carboxypeptidase-like regulatory domain-containing protein [Acidobacteriia bacterium]|nr:carboxypeptidase-like regulatory domain-containing protein [Terriglobia bacterium]